MNKLAFSILTGEYPPQPGGVADYTAQLANRLAECRPVVVAPECPNQPPPPAGICFVSLPDCFGIRGLLKLDRHLARTVGPNRLLLQYTPHAFGMKALNLPLCFWLGWRRWGCGDDVHVMFHEVAFPFVRRPLRHNLIAVGNRLMAFVLMQACTRAYVAIPAWAEMLRKLGGRRVPIAWLPVPANVPDEPQPAAPSIRENHLRGGGDALVGHFGTYPEAIASSLAPAMARLLADRPATRFLLLGRGGDGFLARLKASHPAMQGKAFATGGLGSVELSANIQACDLMLQPYPDGISTRRGTAMACLANGVPVVTSVGPLSEPLWAAADSVCLAASLAPDAVAAACVNLLDSPEVRRKLGERGRELYRARFSLERTVQTLLADERSS